MNYYRRYSGDYLRDTSRLTLTEHGAYCLLMDYYYADEKPLPTDKDELYLMVRAMRPDDRKAVDKVLSVFFTKAPDGYHQKRIDHEIEVSKKARTNGKGGGRPRTGEQTGTITGSETGTGTDDITGQETGTPTGEGGGSGHPPTTNHQPPTTSLQPPTKPKVKSEAQQRPPDPEPPLGVSRETWDAYLELRKRKRAPITDRALTLIHRELGRARLESRSVEEIVKRSVMNGWTGLFPDKQQNGVNGNGKFNVHAAGRKMLADELASKGVGDRPASEVLAPVPGEVHKLLPRSGNG